MVSADPTWWGRFPVALGGCLALSLGPLELWIQRRQREWYLTWRHGDDPVATACRLGTGSRPADTTDMQVTRHALGATADSVLIDVALTDRPMVLGLDTRLFLPPGQKATLYFSTPLSLRLSDGDGIPLTTIASVLPVETWFGASTIDGVLAYASRTMGRLALGELLLRRHRAVTAVTLHNRARDAMAVERIHVPMPSLALYVAQDDCTLWTNALTIERDAGGTTGRVAVGKGPPAAKMTRLTQAQVAPQTGVLHAVSALFT